MLFVNSIQRLSEWDYSGKKPGTNNQKTVKTFVTTQQMTPTLRFRVIHERNYTLSMEMSFFTMPLAQTWIIRYK